MPMRTTSSAAAVLERRVAGDHEQGAEARQLRDDVVGDAVAEILLFGVAAHVGERQHGDRGFRCRRASRSALGCRARVRAAAVAPPASRLASSAWKRG